MAKALQIMIMVLLCVVAFIAANGHPVAMMFCALLAIGWYYDKKDERMYRNREGPFK